MVDRPRHTAKSQTTGDVSVSAGARTEVYGSQRREEHRNGEDFQQNSVFRLLDDASRADISLEELSNNSTMTTTDETEDKWNQSVSVSDNMRSHADINACADDYYHVVGDTCDLLTEDAGSAQSALSRRTCQSRDHQVTGELPNGNSVSDGCQGKPGHVATCHGNQPRGMDRMARNQLIAVSILSALFMIAEIVGGLLSNSLALVTDATHLASDLTSFLVSLFALWLATKPPTARMTFGYLRAEVLGAMVSILIIWIVTGVLIYMAVRRVLNQDYHIEPVSMLITAAVGVAFNIVMAIVLHSGIFKKCQLPTSLGHNHSHGSQHGNHDSHGNHTSHSNPRHDNNSQDTSYRGHRQDLHDTDTEVVNPVAMGTEDVTTYHSNINIRAAVLHVIGDLIQSIGVLIAAIIIKVKPEYKLADPICTFVFSVLVFITTVTVLRDIGVVIMEAVPRGVDVQAIRKDLLDIEGVKSVHSLYIWSLTINKTAVAVHLAARFHTVQHQTILNAAGNLLRTKHHVMYPTIQVEEYDDAMSMCAQCNR